MEEKKDKVIKLIRLQGEVKDGKTLIGLQEQLGEDEFDTLILEIASQGGSVAEGLAIMVWLDEMSKAGKEIISIVVANAYSIASLIMLAADYRLISKHAEVMVHNPMVPELSYANADELEKYANELRQLEAVMYELYMIFTGLSKEKIKVLMDNETYLTPAEAVENGFADQVVDIKPKSFEMTTINTNTFNMSKTLNILNQVIAMVSKADFVNQIYSTDDGGEVEIFQANPTVITIGDRTNIENADEIKIADGSKIKIEDFIITEIDKEIDAPEVEEDEVEETPAAEGDVEEVIKETIVEPAVEEVIEDAPKKAKTDMPSKVIEKTESVTITKETVAAKISEIMKFEFETVQDTFEIGGIVEYIPYHEGDEPMTINSGEYQLEDGRKILVDSDGIIQLIKDAPAAPAAVEEVKEDDSIIVEAKATGDDDKAEAKAEGDDKDKSKAKAEGDDKDKSEAKGKAKEEDDKKVDAKAAEFNEGSAPEGEKALLKALAEMKVTMKAMEDEMKAIKEDAEAKGKAADKFEALATEAIDKIATNSVSGFKPSAKSVVIANPEAKGFVANGNSIFAKAKAKAIANK